MNAKMRIGHFTATQPLRLRVNMTALKTALAGGLLALTLTPSLAAGLPGYDTNLERWAKESLAKRIGDIRDSYEPSETMKMVTEADVKRGPLPLSAERNNDPIWVMATMRFGTEINVAGPVQPPVIVVQAISNDTPYPPREFYTGALVLAGR
jgi:hypothetical protein